MASAGRERECAGPTGRARTSKIARLPAAVREELNERLLEGQGCGEILAWVNSVPAARSVLEQRFAAQPITEMNLSRWRQGGYAGWLERRHTTEAVEALAAGCAGQDDAVVERINGHLAVVLSARLFVETQKFSAMAEGPEKTAAWQRLLMAYVLLRRADVYGVKARHAREKAKIVEEAMRERAEAERPNASEERVEKIFNTVCEEIKRRYPNGLPEEDGCASDEALPG